MVSNSPQYIAVYNPENSATYYQICVSSEMVVQGFERPLGSDPAPPPPGLRQMRLFFLLFCLTSVKSPPGQYSTLLYSTENRALCKVSES